jgi:hypothetical protein
LLFTVKMTIAGLGIAAIEMMPEASSEGCAECRAAKSMRREFEPLAGEEIGLKRRKGPGHTARHAYTLAVRKYIHRIASRRLSAMIPADGAKETDCYAYI